jgi:hypothetical protein
LDRSNNKKYISTNRHKRAGVDGRPGSSQQRRQLPSHPTRSPHRHSRENTSTHTRRHPPTHSYTRQRLQRRYQLSPVWHRRNSQRLSVHTYLTYTRYPVTTRPILLRNFSPPSTASIPHPPHTTSTTSVSTDRPTDDERTAPANNDCHPPRRVSRATTAAKRGRHNDTTDHHPDGYGFSFWTRIDSRTSGAGFMLSSAISLYQLALGGTVRHCRLRVAI